MGAVFSYSSGLSYRVIESDKFQSLMGAVFSYSREIDAGGGKSKGVSIPDGCSVQL